MLCARRPHESRTQRPHDFRARRPSILMRLASDAVGRSSYKGAPCQPHQIVGHRPARGPTVPRIPFLLSRIGSVRRGRGFPVRRGSLAVPSNLRLPNARSERLGVPKPPIRASRPPRIEGVDAVRIGPNASTRTGCLGFGAADVRSGGVLGKRAASGGVAHGEGAVSMSTRAHRGTSRVFWKPIRAPECRPDRQKCRPDQSASAPWHCPGPAANRNAHEDPGRLTPLPLARMPQRTP